MSQTFDRAPPRFSRRQVTKRKFNILGSPNVLQNVQTVKNTTVDAEKKKDTESKKNKTPRNQKSKTQQSQSTRRKGNAEDSSASEVQEQNENEASRDPPTDDADSYKDVGQGESTPKKQQKLALSDDTQAPGDVSVSFLASTPKPGRSQLSRRRPMSPVTETSEMLMGSHQATRTEVQRRKEWTGVPSPRKRSPRKQSPQKLSPQKRAGASINEMIASSNKSRLENKRKNSEIHKKLSVNNLSHKTESTRSTEASASDNDSVRTTYSAKKQKVSVPKRDIPVRRGNSNVEQTTTFSKSTVDNSVTETEGAESLSKSTSSNRNIRTATLGARNSPKRLQKGNNISRTRLCKNVTSDESDVTIRNNSARVSLSSNRRKSAVNRNLQALSRTKDSTVTTVPDQTLVIWETEGQRRSRTDLVDLDVVLNTMKETIASRMDVYDRDEEQSAVHSLEKYLTQDITHMIHGVQAVTELQSKIKKCGQSIKQKQKSLMALQKERVEQEEKCQPEKKIVEKNDSMATINLFLKDLGKVIDMC